MKRLLLTSSAFLTLLVAPYAHAGPLTPDELTAATTANNTDLLLIYRNHPAAAALARADNR